MDLAYFVLTISRAILEKRKTIAKTFDSSRAKHASRRNWQIYEARKGGKGGIIGRGEKMGSGKKNKPAGRAQELGPKFRSSSLWLFVLRPYLQPSADRGCFFSLRFVRLLSSCLVPTRAELKEEIARFARARARA